MKATYMAHLQQFCSWLEQYFSAELHSALNGAREDGRISKYDDVLQFRAKRTSLKKMFDFENVEEPIQKFVSE
jgi:hypothetical protein